MSAHKTSLENYNDWLAYARKLTAKQIQYELINRAAYHSWAVKAYEKALEEKTK